VTDEPCLEAASPRDVIGASLRYRVEPRDVSPAKAARRLGLTLAVFDRLKDDLYSRGFPRPDPTTGNYDLNAIAAWQDKRSGLSTPLSDEQALGDPGDGFTERAARLLNGQR
jgi:hypothetical protein